MGGPIVDDRFAVDEDADAVVARHVDGVLGAGGHLHLRGEACAIQAFADAFRQRADGDPVVDARRLLVGEEVAQLALELGLPWLNIQFLTPFGRATKWVAPDTQKAADLAMRVIDKYRDRMKFQVINLPFCFMPGYEEFLTGDLLKLARHMIFVNNEDVNLAEYQAERRTKKPVCETCPHACFCGGFYELERATEPPWLIAPEDLLRPVRRAEP